MEENKTHVITKEKTDVLKEVAVGMLYDMLKNPVWYDCNKQMAAIKFLLFLEWNNALYVDGEKRNLSWNGSYMYME